MTNYPDNFSGPACDAWFGWSDDGRVSRRDVDAFVAMASVKFDRLMAELKADFRKTPMANLADWTPDEQSIEATKDNFLIDVRDALVNVIRVL